MSSLFKWIHLDHVCGAVEGALEFIWQGCSRASDKNRLLISITTWSWRKNKQKILETPLPVLHWSKLNALQFWIKLVRGLHSVSTHVPAHQLCVQSRDVHQHVTYTVHVLYTLPFLPCFTCKSRTPNTRHTHSHEGRLGLQHARPQGDVLVVEGDHAESNGLGHS